MAFRLLQAFPAQWSDLNGNPLVGGTLEFQNWNTSAPISLYTDASGTALGTSCTLNSLGLPQTSGGTACQLFGSDADTSGYKIIRKDAGGSVIGPALGPIYTPFLVTDITVETLQYDGDPLSETLDDIMVMSGVRQGLVAGQNIDEELTNWISDYTNTGAVLKLRPGVYTITAHYEIQGWTLDLSAGAEIEVNGTDRTVFAEGGLELLSGGRIVGGIVYTSGTMDGPFSSAPTTRPCAVLVNGGDLDGTTVYSQLNTCVRHYTGKIKCKVIGGSYYGFAGYYATDVERDIDVESYNTGVRYTAKVPASTGTISTVFGCNLYAIAVIDSEIRVRYYGRYSTKQCLWITVADEALYAMNNVVVLSAYSYKAGTYLADGTTETGGAGAGTGCEIIGCPNVRVMNPVNIEPLGYGIVVAGCPDAEIHGGESESPASDPNVLVLRSPRTKVIDHVGKGGSVGFGVTNSDDTKLINCSGIDNTYGPITFTFDEDGHTLFVHGFTAINGSTAAGYAGSYSGPGELQDFCRVKSNDGATIANVIMSNSTLNGQYTNIFAPIESATILSVYENNNTYACPFVPPPMDLIFRGRGQWLSHNVAIPLITGSTAGRAGSGLITIDNVTVNNSYLLTITDIEPYVGTYATPSADAGDWWVVWYVQYTTDMNATLRIGLDDSGASSTTRYGLSTFLTATVNNSDDLYTDGYQVGEWMPMAVNLRSFVHSAVTDYSVLTRLQVIKNAYAPNYELILTVPVLVMSKAIG